MYRFVATDASGVKRAWGEGATPEEAHEQCRKAVYEYVKRRPDVGEAGEFTMHRDDKETEKRSKQMSEVNKAMSAAFFKAGR